MRRYEFKEGSSSKFWEIELEGESFTTRFGKIGTDGQTSTKEFDSASEARKQYDKIVAEKEKKGYQLVGGAGAAPGGGKAASNPALEAAILASPDDPAPFLVYGDWLQAQGDPRGELIAVQGGLLAKPKDKKLLDKEKDLLMEHEEALLPELMEIAGIDEAFSKTWRLGFLDAVSIGGDEDFGEEIDGEAVLRTLLKLPSAKFLRELRIQVYGTEDGEPDYAGTIKTLAKLGVPKTLRTLAFDIGDFQISWSNLGDLSPLYAQLAGLENLTIKMGKMKLGKMALPSLKKLEIVTGGLDKAALKSVATAAWPKLETLILYFGSHSYGASCKVDDVQPVLDGKAFPKVKHLALANAEFADDIAKAIPRSKIVRQLETLDLSKGMMTDAGADALVEGAGALKHLAKLDVSDNWISGDAQKRLKKAFKQVEIGSQGDPAEEYRFVQVSE